MKLKYAAPLISLQTSLQLGVKRVEALNWSPNNKKLAVCRADNVIQLFDDKGNPKDKFVTRPRDLKNGNEIYIVTGLAFSPDSINIAVAQSDGIIFVYRIGEDFKMKKSITNKFAQPAPVTSVVWPTEMEMYCGLSDGKIRLSLMTDRKSTKSTTSYSSDSCVARLIANYAGTELLAAFGDGKIALLSIGNADQTILKVLIRHGTPAVALALGMDCIIAGGSDMKLVFYEKVKGKAKQIFDYSKENMDMDMTCAALSSTGQTLIIGLMNKFKIYHYVNRKKIWEEEPEKNVENLYIPTAMHWRRDNTYVTVATNAGTFHMFEAVYKRSKSDKLELNYIVPSHVIVKVLDTKLEVTVKSKYGNEILEVKLMGADRFLVAKTNETIIITELEDEGMSSEIPWVDTEETERYYFENPWVCMIFHSGELTLVEYGQDEILGTFRTQFVNPHVISVRVNERISHQEVQEGRQNKKMAYLLDLKSIAIVDLEYGLTIGTITHDSKIDWLELNETASKLLYRDRRGRLTLMDVNNLVKHTLDLSCTFVSWVPGYDVIVCQSKKQLRIWYNIDTPELSVNEDIRGIAMVVTKENDHNVVLVKDGNAWTGLPLDESRIQFTAALETQNLPRATAFLEECKPSPDVSAMWAKLGKAAAMTCSLRLALKAYSAIDDIPKAKFLSSTIKLTTEEIDEDTEHEELVRWKSSYEVQALMYLLIGETKMAEALYYNHGDIEGILQMYDTLHRYNDAAQLASSKHHPQSFEIMRTLTEKLEGSGQYDLAAEVLIKHGHPEAAVYELLNGALPTKAAKVLIKYRNTLKENRELTDLVITELHDGEFFEESGELFEALGVNSSALQCYRKGQFYDKAIKLAKKVFQNEVVPLEEEWGDHLMSLRQPDAACNHYIEAGSLLKALEASIDARQYKKAAQIITAFNDPEPVAKHYIKLADYYKSVSNFSEAEICYLKGGVPKNAVEMYNEQDRWEDAHRVATNSSISRADLNAQYMEQARIFQDQGRLSNAEKLLVTIGEVDLAISMYAKAKLYDEVIRLVEAHHPEHINETLKHLAEIYSQDDNFKAAEVQYIKANHWEEAVHMYQAKGLWEDAYRVARAHGGIEASRHVIYRWASTLPPDAAVKLLNKYGYIYDFIEFNCVKGSFRLAEEIAELGARDKLTDIHATWGQYCEERNNVDEAKGHYLEANMPHRAIDMFIRIKDLPQAVEIAEQYAKEELQRVLVLYAETLFDRKDYNNFEAIIIRAEKPEVGIEMYKNQGMWAEALRMGKQFAPNLVSRLNEEYAIFESVKEVISKDPYEIIEQAKEYERQGDYRKAVERYLQLTPTIMEKYDVLAKCWIRAAELASKFLLKDQSLYVIKELAPMLDNIKYHEDAASLYLKIGLYKEALNSMISGQLWPEANHLAQAMGPDTEEFVKFKQAESLKNSGQMERLEGVNIEAALDILCENNQWSKCLERAKNDDELHAKYLAKYITYLLATQHPKEAVKAYMEHGIPINKQHIRIYKGIATLLFSEVHFEDYEVLKNFRDMSYEMITRLEVTGADQRAKVYYQLERLLSILNLMVNKIVFKSIPQLEILSAKISVSLLRFIGVLPAETTFYEAGIFCRKVNWKNMAFVFLNRYLDIREAIVDGTNELDNSDFLDTDIPTDLDLGVEAKISMNLHDEAKEWVLTASMDPSIQQTLKKDERNVFEGSLISGDEVYDPCILTGYPVIDPKVSFRITKKYANKEDWNRFVIACRSQPNNERLTNIMGFITKWCGPQPSYSY